MPPVTREEPSSAWLVACVPRSVWVAAHPGRSGGQQTAEQTGTPPGSAHGSRSAPSVKKGGGTGAEGGARGQEEARHVSQGGAFNDCSCRVSVQIRQQALVDRRPGHQLSAIAFRFASVKGGEIVVCSWTLLRFTSS